MHSPLKEMPEFTMDGVGKITEVGWQGMILFSIDDKNGCYHVKINDLSWKYFAFIWKAVTYVFVILCFGWLSRLFIHSTLTEKRQGGFKK